MKLKVSEYLLYSDILIIFLVFFIFLLNFFGVNSPWFLALTVLSCLILPGYFLKRLIRIKFFDRLGNFLLAFTLGLIFNLGLAFIVILLGLTITAYLWLFLILGALLFIGALIYDHLRPIGGEFEINLKKIFVPENVIYLFVIILGVLILVTIDQIGTTFQGDPVYHLAIIRKVVSGNPLTMDNLAYVKNQLELAYGIPVWHAVLGLYSTITRVDLIVLFREIPLSLSILSFLVWAWFLSKLIPNRKIALLALMLFMIYQFSGNGYFFSRLAVPDTFNQLILLPLAFGLALTYIFNKESSFKLIIILSIFLPLMGLIHWTQYFYYLFTLGLFGIIYAIVKFRKPDFKTTLQRFCGAIFFNLILVLPILTYFQLKTNAISSNINAYQTVGKTSNNDRFTKYSVDVQTSLFFVPFLLFFVRKYRQLIFFFAVFSLTFLVYNIPGLGDFLRSVLSHVFVNRIFTNIGEWPFVTWAIVLGFLLLLVDRVLKKVDQASKISLYIVEAIVLIFVFSMLILEFSKETLSTWYDSFFNSKPIQAWFSANYLWLFVILIIVGLGIYFFQRNKPKLEEFFDLSEPKNLIVNFSLIFLIVLFFSTPAIGHWKTNLNKEITNGHFFGQPYDPTFDIVNPDKFGGLDLLSYIKQNIPENSVFDTNTDANYTLAVMVDVHMASMNYDVDPTLKYRKLYDPNVPLDQKISMLKEGDIDYLIYQYQYSSSTPFDTYPQFFQPIYTNDLAVLFKINKEAI